MARCVFPEPPSSRPCTISVSQALSLLVVVSCFCERPRALSCAIRELALGSPVSPRLHPQPAEEVVFEQASIPASWAAAGSQTSKVPPRCGSDLRGHACSGSRPVKDVLQGDLCFTASTGPMHPPHSGPRQQQQQQQQLGAYTWSVCWPSILLFVILLICRRPARPRARRSRCALTGSSSNSTAPQ